ncbi:MAG: hypothetical protein LBT65_05350 [Synergistaceae bacterium]|jgi:hypothetical protein|nr:hypothetical protein [Synergistaceae bacterium]
MMHVACWLVQDMLSVLTGGILRIPEIFLLSLVYRLLTQERDMNLSVIWGAFAGGLFWDLRWVGIPGFFTLSYVCVVMAAIWAWNALPASGRTPLVIFFMFWAAQLVSPVLSLFFPGRGVAASRWVLFAVQQGCVVPLALLAAFFFVRRMKDHNA